MRDRLRGNESLPREKHSGRPGWKKAGMALVILSCVFYGALLLVPLTPYKVSTKAIISTTLVVLGEASFWLGGFILGREIVVKYRKYLNPVNWFKKRDAG